MDGTVLLWEPNRAEYSRQVHRGVDPIVSIAISGMTGNIAVITARGISVYSINGECLTILESNDSVLSTSPVTNVEFCVRTDDKYEASDILLTGHENGSLNLWELCTPASWKLRHLTALTMSQQAADPAQERNRISSIRTSSTEIYVADSSGDVYKWS